MTWGKARIAKSFMYYVYIVTNKSHSVLYTGMTNDLVRRIYEHKEHLVEGFTAKYNADKLVYYDSSTDVREVIAREKQIKGWRRTKKIALIESENPDWLDLSDQWMKPDE